MTKLSKIATAVALSVMAAGAATANTVNGSLWIVAEAIAQNATIANALTQGAPDVTFSVNTPITFNSNSGYTIGDFLASGGAAVLTGSSAVLSTLMDTGGNGTLMYFTGQVTVANGQLFNVTHDDGFELEIGGASNFFYSNPGPTAPVNTPVTYDGASGTFGFRMSYGECCGAPAVFNIDLPFTNVPEPGSLALVGGALTALGWSRRRRSV
jgi:PEP-CTERM motif